MTTPRRRITISNIPILSSNQYMLPNQIKDAMRGDGFKDILNKILPTRKDFPPAVRKAIKDYGQHEIKSITVGREPVQSMITKALDFLTQGKLKEQLKTMKYDDLYHLFMIVGLEDGSHMHISMLVEKNSVVNMKKVDSSYGGSDKMKVDVNKKINFGEMINNAVNKIGPSIFLYDSVNNNCQKFISDLLKCSGLMTPALNTFINQDIEKVLSTSPGYAKKIADTFTEGSAKIDRLLNGAGKKPPMIRRGAGSKSAIIHSNPKKKSK